MWRLKTSDGPPPLGNSCLVQPEWRSWTCSARHRKYGIQPASTSVMEILSSGKRFQKSAHISSPRVKIDMVDDIVMRELAGASGESVAERDDEPRWQHSTVPQSTAAAKSGSQ